jgi:hypothetical protein
VPIVTTRVVGLAAAALETGVDVLLPVDVADTLPVVVVVVVCAAACSTSARIRFADGGAFSLPVPSRPATALAIVTKVSQSPQAQMVAVAAGPAESTAQFFKFGHL